MYRLPRCILERGIFTELVLRPHRVVERERDARLAADAVEGADRARLTRPDLVGRRVRIQVVEDVHQRHPVAVLREIEQTAMGAFHLFDPVVGPRLLRCGRASTNDRSGRGSDHATQEAATMGRL